MKRESADMMLSGGARAARAAGLTAEQAIVIVARVFGAVIREGRISGWVMPDDQRPVHSRRKGSK